MIRTFLLLMTLLMSSCATNTQELLFNGNWEVLYYDQENNPTYSIQIKLSQEGNNVVGKHLIIKDRREIERWRIKDAGEEKSIEGTVEGRVATVNIVSGRISDKEDATGVAQLEIIENGYIRFTLIKAPKGRHLFHDNEVLVFADPEDF